MTDYPTYAHIYVEPDRFWHVVRRRSNGFEVGRATSYGGALEIADAADRRIQARRT